MPRKKPHPARSISLVCESHRILGMMYRSKGETEKAVHHFEVDLGIATPFDWHDHLFWVHYELVELFLREGRSDDAQTHVERAKSYTANNAYTMGGTMVMQAMVWYMQRRFEEARSEFLRVVDLLEKLGATGDLEVCRRFLQAMERE